MPDVERRDGGSIPRPDPTLLTMQALERQISGLRDLLDEKIRGTAETVKARLDAMDKALLLAESSVQIASERFRDRIDEKIAAVHNVNAERFLSIDKTFHDLQASLQQELQSNRTAQAAAFTAMRDTFEQQTESFALAVTKSEIATDKRIEQQAGALAAAGKTTDGKIDDIKDRLTRIEGRDLGVATTERRATQHNQWAISAGIGLVAVLLSVAVVMIGFNNKNREPTFEHLTAVDKKVDEMQKALQETRTDLKLLLRSQQAEPVR